MGCFCSVSKFWYSVVFSFLQDVVVFFMCSSPVQQSVSCSTAFEGISDSVTGFRCFRTLHVELEITLVLRHSQSA